jgi:hypothetical protein
MADLRSRRQSGLDAVLLDVDRELVLASGLMSASDYDNPVKRRGTRRFPEVVPEDITGHQGSKRAGGWRNGLAGQSLPAISGLL